MRKTLTALAAVAIGMGVLLGSAHAEGKKFTIALIPGLTTADRRIEPVHVEVEPGYGLLGGGRHLGPVQDGQDAEGAPHRLAAQEDVGLREAAVKGRA